MLSSLPLTSPQLDEAHCPGSPVSPLEIIKVSLEPPALSILQRLPLSLSMGPRKHCSQPRGTDATKESHSDRPAKLYLRLSNQRPLKKE